MASQYSVDKLSPVERELLQKELEASDVTRQWFAGIATPAQHAVHACAAWYYSVDAANQSGKTASAIADCAALFRGIHPHRVQPPRPVQILVLAPSRAQAAGVWSHRLLTASDVRKTIVTPIRQKEVNLAGIPFIPKDELEGGKPDWQHGPGGKYIGYMRHKKTGNVLRMALSGVSQTWQRVQGFPYDAIYRDECVGSTELTPELIMRLKTSQSEFMDGKFPWPAFYGWFATETLVNPEYERFKERCQLGAVGHKYLQLPNVNPITNAAVIEIIRGTLTEEQAAIRLDNTSGAGSDMRVFGRHMSEKRHVMPAVYEPTPADNLVMAWDPGLAHPFGLIGACITPDKPWQLRIIRAYTGRRCTLDVVANYIAEFADGRFLEAVIHDPSGNKQEHSGGQRISDQLLTILDNMGVKLQRGMLKGRNRYESTIPLVQRALDPNPADPNADPLLVFDPDDGTNNMGRVWTQFQRYSFLPGMQGILRNDAIRRVDDDLVDPVRYLCSRWLPQGLMHIRREPNPRKHFLTKPSTGMPAPRSRADAPWALVDGMSDDERTHAIRMRASMQSIDARMPHSANGMAIGTWRF